METILLQTESKEKAKLLLQLSSQLNVRHKKITKAQLEDFLLGISINEGRKSGYASKEKIMKALSK